MVTLEQAQSMLVELRDRIYSNMAAAQWRSIFERFVVFIRVPPWLQGKRLVHLRPTLLDSALG